MTRTQRALTGCALAAMLFGLASSRAPAQGPQPPSLPPAPAGAPGAADEAPAPPDEPVLLVTSVEVLRSAGQPALDILRVNGLAASRSWANPQLVPTYAGKPNDGVLDLQLVATPPDESELADGFAQMSAVFVIPADLGVTGVRVRGADNAVTIAQLPGRQDAAPSVSDCADCLGKTFVDASDNRNVPDGSVARRNLPRALRVLRPADGVHGAAPDPNRLTLVLDDHDVIEQAFWE